LEHKERTEGIVSTVADRQTDETSIATRLGDGQRDAGGVDYAIARTLSTQRRFWKAM
jgi:hypothetical protein